MDKATRDEIDDLRRKVAELVEHVNRESQYNEGLNAALHIFERHHVWRFVLMVKRIPLPVYRCRPIAHMRRVDRSPVQRNGDSLPSVVEGETVAPPQVRRPGKRYRRDNV